MSKLFYKSKPLIGLDISQTGVKVMAVDPKHWLVLGYGSLDLDPSKVQVSLDNPEDTYLAENINTLLQQNIVGSLHSDHVVVGLPTGRTFSRTFTLPTSEEKHIAGAVEVDAAALAARMALADLQVGETHAAGARDREHRRVRAAVALDLYLGRCCGLRLRAAYDRRAESGREID